MNCLIFWCYWLIFFWCCCCWWSCHIKFLIKSLLTPLGRRKTVFTLSATIFQNIYSRFNQIWLFEFFFFENPSRNLKLLNCFFSYLFQRGFSNVTIAHAQFKITQNILPPRKVWLASLAKWLSVRWQTKWLWVKISLLSLYQEFNMAAPTTAVTKKYQPIHIRRCFEIYTGKYLWWSLFLIKFQVLSL